MILWNGAGRIVDGNIIPKAANSDFPEKKGFTQMGPAMYNTRVLPLESTYHKKAVVREGRLQVKDLTDGSLDVWYCGGRYNYTAVLIGHLDACDSTVVEPGTTMNFYPGSCFVVKEGSDPVVVGPGMTLNLGCPDNPSHVDCSFKGNTINIQSGSVSPLNDLQGGLHEDSTEGVWIRRPTGRHHYFPILTPSELIRHTKTNN